ncbi:MAG: DivIVA domain-containing protein [Deltaproteobacteria bacterium]|nr:DivIVA domain-containing protein [Deltaproteobacteria bacterium]
MKITPVDIQQQQFAVKFRGYDIQEVDAFLETVASELEEQIKRVNELRDELERKEERIWEYQNMEKTLKETLMIAQVTSEEVKKNAEKAAEDLRAHAQKEAELIVSEAKQDVKNVIENTNARLAHLQGDISDLRRKKLIMERELRSVLETHLKLLESSSEDAVTRIDDPPRSEA